MKIHICGIYGSGKSTLAKQLSEVLKTDYYSLDDIKYEIKYSKIRPVEIRIKEVEKICNSDRWITEGTWSNYAEDAFRKADVIILMNTPKLLCGFRILKRHLLRKKHEEDTLIGAIKLIREVYRYHSTKNPVSLYMHKNLIIKYRKKHVIIKKKSEVLSVIKKITIL